MLKLKPIKPMKKNAQIEMGAIVVVSIIIALVIFAPIMLRIIGTVTGTFFKQMNETSPNAVTPASDAVDKVYNFFDYLIIISIFINIILLFISAWFIDTNPVFILLYIIFAFILILFLPNLVDAIDSVWIKMEDQSSLDVWEDTSLNLQYTDFIRRNLTMFTLVIIILSGVVTYAKFKLRDTF